jgi:non-canonical purine NTP pyrophosphatase (RdgB/HAM1 family)
MVPRPVLVTSRAEKAVEAKRLGFDLVCVPLDLPEPQALDPGEIVETKARAAHAVLQRPVIVEDSGLSIGAWKGFPGALIKWLERSAGVGALPRMLDGFSDRSATAVCAIAYFDGSRIVAARGEAAGRIVSTPRGSGGFGWDALFVPEGSDRTFAEMTGEEKDALSHRRRAWEALAKRISEVELPAGAEARKTD